MEQKIMSVKDTKAGRYGALICVVREQEALRALQNTVNGPDNNDIAKYPSDFELYELGVFNEETGKIVYTEPRFIINCGALVKNTELDALRQRVTQLTDELEELRKEV